MMLLKAWHKYQSYKLVKGKKVYGDVVIPLQDVALSQEILNRTNYEEVAWDNESEE